MKPEAYFPQLFGRFQGQSRGVIMKIRLPDFVGLYQEGGPCLSKLVPTDVAIRAEVELWGQPRQMAIMLPGGGTCDEVVVEIRFQGYKRYLIVRELGVELPTPVSSTVEAI